MNIIQMPKQQTKLLEQNYIVPIKNLMRETILTETYEYG